MKKMILIQFYLLIWFSSEIIYCFIALQIKKVLEQHLEEYENIAIIKMDLKKVLKKIKQVEITDSKTICAMLAYVSKKKLYKFKQWNSYLLSKF